MSVQMGGILVINANETALINSKTDQELQFEWICPPEVTMCRGESMMSHFYNSEIEYMQTYTYVLKVRTDYALLSSPPYL